MLTIKANLSSLYQKKSGNSEKKRGVVLPGSQLFIKNNITLSFKKLSQNLMFYSSKLLLIYCKIILLTNFCGVGT